MSAKKRLASSAELGPGGKLKREVMDAARWEIRQQWHDMPVEQKKMCEDMYRERHVQRKRSAQEASDDRALSMPGPSHKCEAKGHWAFGTTEFSVSPSLLKSYFDCGGKLPPKPEVFDESEYRISEVSEGRCLCQSVGT